VRKHHSQDKVSLLLVTSILALCLLSGGLLFSTHGKTASATDNVFYNNFIGQATNATRSTNIDLAVGNIWLDSTDSQIRYTVFNRGSGESPETYAHLWIDGQKVESRRVAPLAAGHSREEYFDYVWQCTQYEDIVRVTIDPVIRVIEDRSGVEIGLGELDYGNNQAEVTWRCKNPDLRIESLFWNNGGTISYAITNEGRYPAGRSTTRLHVYDEAGEAVYVSFDRIDGLAPGESRQESFSDPFPCSPRSIIHVKLEADVNGAVTEISETNNSLAGELVCGSTATSDLLIAGIWLEDKSTLCYEIANQGTLESRPTTTRIEIHLGKCGGHETIYQEEPGLASGNSRIVCLDISSLPENWCDCKTLTVKVEADYDAILGVEPFDPPSNDVLTTTFDNLCADGIQNQDEEGIDCGGSCPASCRDCFADADFGGAEDAGYFCLNSSIVLDTARLALQEYANCLRNPDCRATLLVTDPLMDFSSVTAADLEQSTDYIMEAVAYYVHQHTRYMLDEYGDICDPGGGPSLDPGGAIKAEDMILLSGRRSGIIPGYEPVDACPGDYCGDCEDYAILREALMRSLGVSWRCAFCADHYDSYFGGGHTFNLVYYRNKWRIMDHGPLGTYFSISRHWDAHIPHNVWNDRVGEYWCPDWRADPACWYCCNQDPYGWTQNYNDGEVCGDGWPTYYEECAP
jgi:hypothetical protein